MPPLVQLVGDRLLGGSGAVQTNTSPESRLFGALPTSSSSTETRSDDPVDNHPQRGGAVGLERLDSRRSFQRGRGSKVEGGGRVGALRLLDSQSNPHKGIERFGIPLIQTIIQYVWRDLFTTLLNAPRGRFVAVFFAVYLSVYVFFAIIYIMFPADCMSAPGRNFGHSFWFSFWTASTIGYSGDILYPNPDCNLFNLVVMINIISANLVDYCLMGVVFARFAAPMPKAKAIRFSSTAVLYQGDPASFWKLSFRIANIRKHSILQPEISLFLAIPEGGGGLGLTDSASSDVHFVHLELQDAVSQVVNLKLGLPSSITHIVNSSSPIFNLSLEQMEAAGMEILCLMDGMDPMTSNSMQARHSYRPVDIRMNERFNAIEIQSTKRGRMGLDFSQFDRTTAGGPAWTAGGDLRAHVVQTSRLRTQTLQSLSPIIPDSSVRGGKGGSSVLSSSSANRVGSVMEQRHLRGGGGTEVEVEGMGGRGDPLGASPPPPSPHSLLSSQQVASLIEAVLSDANSNPAIRRYASLARAEVLAANLHMDAGDKGHARRGGDGRKGGQRRSHESPSTSSLSPHPPPHPLTEAPPLPVSSSSMGGMGGGNRHLQELDLLMHQP